MKKRLQFALGIVISLLFLYLAMRQVDWPELISLLRRANYWYLVPAFVLLGLINLVRAYRWKLLMGPEGTISLWRVFRFVNIGYFFNNIFPAKAGELVRAYLAGRMIPGGVGQAFSAVLIERLLDVLSVVALLVILTPFVALPSWATRGAALAGGVALLGLIFLALLSHYGERGIALLWRVLGRLPLIGSEKVRSALASLLEGFAVLYEPKLLLGVVASSASIWMGYATFNYLFFIVFGMYALPFSAACFVLCCTGLTMILPSSPGAMGVFEWAALQALTLFAVARSDALGYALGLHVFTNVTLILFGAVGALREGIDYRQIQAEAEMRTDGVGTDGVDINSANEECAN